MTYAYSSDAHDNHVVQTGVIRHFAYGPGEAGYRQQLQSYDQAFATFFDNLAQHGINKSNTLFVFTVDEGDHFVGDAPSNPGCDGVNLPCTYNRVGEINFDLRGRGARSSATRPPSPCTPTTRRPSTSTGIRRRLTR